MAFKRFSLIRGDSDNYGVIFKRKDGTLYNIKNWTVFFTLKKNVDLPDSQASLQKIITTFSDTTSGTSGSANIPIIPTDTIDLDLGEYFFDIAVCTTPDSESFTVLRGKILLEWDATRTIGTAGTG